MTNSGQSSDIREWRVRQGRYLLQGGMLLFLLALLMGLVVHKLEVPRMALSAHLLGITQGLFLMVLGLLWPKLILGRVLSWAALVLVVYGCLAALSANLLGAAWGAGNSMLPFAAGQARGSALQETIITVCLRTAAASLIAASLMIIWGLRSPPRSQPPK